MVHDDHQHHDTVRLQASAEDNRQLKETLYHMYVCKEMCDLEVWLLEDYVIDFAPTSPSQIAHRPPQPTVENITVDSVELSWGAQGSTAKEYNVYKKRLGGRKWEYVTRVGTPACTLTNLNPGSTLHIKVAQAFGKKEGVASQEVTFTTKDDGRKLDRYLSSNSEGDADNTWHKIACHRVILAASSPTFMALLGNGMMESKSNVVKIRDTSAEAFGHLLCYIYGQKLEIERSKLLELYLLADRYGFPSLADNCIELMGKTVASNTCFATLQCAELFQKDGLYDKAFRFLVDNFEEVIESPDFLEAPHDLLLKVFGHDELAVSGEIVVFEALVRWAEYDTSRLDAKNNLVNDLLQHVRFPLMSPEELYSRVREEELLSSCPSFKPLLKEAVAFLSAATKCTPEHALGVHSKRMDRRVGSLDISSLECVDKVRAHTGLVSCLVNTHNKVISGSSDCQIKIWGESMQKAEATFSGHSHPVTCLALLDHGTLIVSGDSDGQVLVWELESRKRVASLQMHSKAVAGLETFEDVVFSCGDSTVKSWSESSGKIHTLITNSDESTNGDSSRFTSDVAEFTALLPRREDLITGDSNGGLSVWDWEKSESVHSSQPHTKPVLCLSHTPDYVFSGAADGVIVVWSSLLSPLKRFCGHNNMVWRVLPFRNKLISASVDSRICVWDLVTNEREKTLVGHTGGVWALTIWKNMLLSGSFDTTIRIWK